MNQSIEVLDWKANAMWFTRWIGDHDGFGVSIGEVQSVTKEQRTDERQILKLFERDGCLQQLPFRLKWEELVDELFRVR